MGRVVSITWVRGMAWQAEARGHRVVADTTADVGGSDTAMTPGELLVSAMGMCMTMDLSYYAERHPGIDLTRVRFDLTWEDAPDKPSRIGRISGTVRFLDPVPAARQPVLRRVLESCKISRTLAHGVEIDVQTEFGVPDEKGIPQ